MPSKRKKPPQPLRVEVWVPPALLAKSQVPSLVVSPFLVDWLMLATRWQLAAKRPKKNGCKEKKKNGGPKKPQRERHRNKDSPRICCRLSVLAWLGWVRSGHSSTLEIVAIPSSMP